VVGSYHLKLGRDVNSPTVKSSMTMVGRRIHHHDSLKARERRALRRIEIRFGACKAGTPALIIEAQLLISSPAPRTIARLFC
jgi:hypothetical protein